MSEVRLYKKLAELEEFSELYCCPLEADPGLFYKTYKWPCKTAFCEFVWQLVTLHFKNP